MGAAGTVRLRLLLDSADPPSPDGSACTLGLQDKKGALRPPAIRADGLLAFDLSVDLKPGADASGPDFAGPFVHGARGERFLYLSWKRDNGAGYVNRIKVRLCDIGWLLLRAAQDGDCLLETDLSGRRAGGGRVAVDWRLGAP